MVESIFGDGFDLRDYVHRRSLEIQDLRERQLYRQVTDGMMAEMFQYLTEQQAALERRVLSEIRAPGSEFSIYVGLTPRGRYDASDKFLSPICPEDVEDGPPPLSDCLNQEQPKPVERVFLRQDAREVLKFERDGARYQNCADGIVSGCMLTTTEDSIVVNPGIIRYEGDFYLIREPQFALYTPTNTTRVLNLVFHDQVQTDSFVTREIELAFTEGASSEKRYLELCRFKLQPGARLRYTYTSFADRETEYDTLNIIHAPFCGMGRHTLSPEITAHFAREALDAGADGTDALFCMMLLASREPVQAEALEAYIHSKLGKDYACHSNLGMYQGLISCLKQFKGGQDAAAPKRKAWSIMVD